jgi:hypothetical protein
MATEEDHTAMAISMFCHTWVKRWSDMGEFIGISIHRMFADSLLDSAARDTERQYNLYLAMTRSGRATLSKHRYMMCANNPFRIAALLIARRKLQLRFITARRPCNAHEEVIDAYITGKLSEHVYNDPENTPVMEAALERFVANITGGIAYGETICVPL